MLLRQVQTEKIVWLFHEVMSEIFKVSLVSYLICYLVEDYKTGFVTDYFNLNILFWCAIASGVALVWIRGDEVENQKNVPKIHVRNYVVVVLLALFSMALVYTKIRSIGWLAYVIATVAGVIIAMLSLFLLAEGPDQGTSEDGPDNADFITKHTDQSKLE
jgi:hypothetical protein